MGKATNIVKRGARALLGEGTYIGLRNCYRRAWLLIWNLLFTATRHRARFWRAVKLLDSESYCAPATPHRPPFPGYAVVEINNTCNINCLMCDTASARRQKGVIDIGLLERVLAELKQRGIRAVDVHTIGDPLANPKLPAVLAVFRKLRMTPGLSTNGLLIKKHLNTLIEYRDVTSLIRLSIDGATKPTYERIRAGGKWEDLMENLTIASNELVPRGFTLTSNMVVSEDNVSEAGLFVEVFRPFVMPSNMQFSFVNSLAPDTSYFHRVNLFPNHTVPNRPCSLPFSSFWVHLDGRVSSCCRDYHGEVIVGDLKAQSIAQVWEGIEFQKLRAAHAKKDVQQYRLCDNCYIVDPRIEQLFSRMMSYLTCTRPMAPAGYYQERVDAFVEILRGKPPYEEALRISGIVP